MRSPSVNEEMKKEKLFKDGYKNFKEMNYFEAHEVWEELWSDYYLKDRKFVQGLIQLAVSFVHLGNGNMNGAVNQLKKCTAKFEQFSGIHREINEPLLLNQIEQVREKYNEYKHVSNFDWAIVPTLE